MSDRTELKEAQNRIATIWLVGCVIAVILVAARSMSARPAMSAEDGAQWLGTHFAPFTSVALGSIFMRFRGGAPSGDVDTTAYRFTLGLSLLNVVGAWVFLLADPFLGVRPEALLARSDQILPIISALVGTAFGSLFFSAKTGD